MDNKVKDWFFNNLIYFVILLISIIYLFTAIFSIAESGKTLAEILLNSALILVLAYAITTLFDIQGIFKGEKSQSVIKIKSDHETAVTLAEPFANDLDKFCEQENIDNLKQTRTRLLAKAGLNYGDCFNDNGSAKEVKFKDLFAPQDLTEEQKQQYWSKPKRDKNKSKSENDLIFAEYQERITNLAFKKTMFKQAIRVKLTQLTTQDLISNGANKNDKFNFGDTQKEYLKKSISLSIFSKVLIAFIFGYYTITLIQDFHWSYLLWNALQIVTFLAFGVIKYFQAYMFMQNNFVDRTKRQINELKKFLNKQSQTNAKTYIDEIAEQVAKKFEI